MDVLPLRATDVGRAVEPEGANITLQSRFDCCMRNFWAPMSAKVKELGVTVVFRGQRLSESLRALRPKQGGVRIHWGHISACRWRTWTQAQVVDYLKKAKVWNCPRSTKTMSAGPKVHALHGVGRGSKRVEAVLWIWLNITRKWLPWK